MYLYFWGSVIFLVQKFAFSCEGCSLIYGGSVNQYLAQGCELTILDL